MRRRWQPRGMPAVFPPFPALVSTMRNWSVASIHVSIYWKFTATLCQTFKKTMLISFCVEAACVQEDAASADLPDFEHYAAQLRAVVGHLPHLLLRVRGPAVGHRQAGRPLHRVRGQVPREVQGPPQRGLSAK